jgi:integrase
MATPYNRYQEGSVECVKRAKGPDAWVFRWRELQPDGTRLQRKKVIGNLQKYPTKSAAQRAVENFRAEINAQQERIGKMTLGELWGEFQLKRFHEATDAAEIEDEDALSPTTIKNYKDNFKLYILPTWKDVLLEDVRPFKVADWLKTLKATRTGKKLAPASKAKVGNQLSALFSFAILHDLYTQANPIEPVKQSAKRLKKPAVLTIKQIRALLSNLPEPIHRVAILIAAATALRRSEIRGLKWSDIDFDAGWVHLRRGVIGKMKSRLKTEASRGGLPLQPELEAVLLEWRKQTPFRADDDWVLASKAREGRSPIWLESAMQKYIQPAAVSAGITERIGWHTFRRSLGSLMVTMKEHPKVAQELLRHANPRITMELYQQADHDSKRNAQKHTSGLFAIEGKMAS